MTEMCWSSITFQGRGVACMRYCAGNSMAVATSVHDSIFVRAQRCTMYVNSFYVTDYTHTCSEL